MTLSISNRSLRLPALRKVFATIFNLALLSSSAQALEIHWSFDSFTGVDSIQAYDSLGGDHSGTVTGAQLVEGRVGQALYFDGVDDKVELILPTPVDLSEFTVSLFAKAAVTGQVQYASVLSNDSSGDDFQIDVNGSAPGNYRFRSSVVGSSQNQLLEEVGTHWTHFAVVGDANGIRVYQDGQQLQQSLANDHRFETIVVGANRSQDRFFNGWIDEVYLYDEAFTAQQIRHLADNVDPLLVGYFDIQQGSPAGAKVVGKVNLYDNRFAPVLDVEGTYDLELLDSSIFVLNEISDSDNRLFGELELIDASSAVALGDLSVTVILRDQASQRELTRRTFDVHVVQETHWQTIFDRVENYVLLLQSRMWGRHYYDSADVASILAELETERNVGTVEAPIIVKGILDTNRIDSGGAWIADAALPLGFYFERTETEFELYGGYNRIAGTSDSEQAVIVAAEIEAAANIIGGLAYYYRNLPIADGARAPLKQALYDALEQYFAVYPSDVFSDTLAIAYNYRSHAWRMTDPLSGALIALFEDLEADAVAGDTQAEWIVEAARDMMQKVAWGMTEQERALTYDRYFVEDRLEASNGAWSDANRSHRIRSWAAMAVFAKDYNRPVTYLDYWYPGYAEWGKAGTTFLPGWTPSGSLFDLQTWLNSNAGYAAYYKQSGVLPDGTISHHTGARQDLTMIAYGYEWLLAELVTFTEILSDTRFSVDAAPFNFSLDLLLYSYPWLIYEDAIDYQAVGRSYDSDASLDFGSELLDQDLREMDAATSSLTLPRRAEMQVFEDDLDNKNHSMQGNSAWWAADFMIHRHDGSGGVDPYYMSVKMQSARTRGAESFNDPASFHNGSGVLQVKVDGDEYGPIRYDYDQHMLPGITEEMRTDSLPKQSTANLFNPNTFAGAVSNGSYGLSAFEYASDNVYSSATADKAYFFLGDFVIALGHGVTRNNQTEREALNTLYDSDGDPETVAEPLIRIVTVVDHDVLKSDISFYKGDLAVTEPLELIGQTSDRQSGFKNDLALPYRQQIMWAQQGKKGYAVLPTPGEYTRVLLWTNDRIIDSNPDVDGADQTPDTNDSGRLPLFSLKVNHRETPSGTGSYSRYRYVVWPNVEPAAGADPLEDRAEAAMTPLIDDLYANLQIINNDSHQAVYWNGDGYHLAQLVFHQAGALTFDDPATYNPDPDVVAALDGLRVEVDKPALVQLYKLDGGVWEVAVSDPHQHVDMAAIQDYWNTYGSNKFRFLSLNEANEIIVTINESVEPGVYQYQTQGLETRYIAGQTVWVTNSGGSSTLKFNLPDRLDAAAYTYRENLYLGMPARVQLDGYAGGVRDSDQDGIADSQESESDALIMSALGDADHDGKVNALEISMGEDPLSGGVMRSPVFSLFAISDKEYASLNYYVDQSAGFGSVILEESFDLVEWSTFSGVIDFPVVIDGDLVEYEARMPVDVGASKFFRFKLLLD